MIYCILTQYKVHYFKDYKIKNITFNINVSEVEEITGVPPIVLAAIRNTLSNSLRFSPEEEIIEIHLKC
jgi:signal transduction histidine kinase